MNELVERYVHQVGQYAPRRERAEIEAELRSMIQDQLDDRYAGSPSPAEVAAILAELGRPSQLAMSYSGERYLVGPALYPYAMLILRNGWLIIPAIVVFLHIFGALIATEPVTPLNLIVNPLLAALQAALIFTGVVVLAFMMIQQSGEALDDIDEPFDPANLPEADDPRIVNRFEASFGVVLAIIVIVLYAHFLRVGGLTLHVNPTDPADVILVSAAWLVLLIVTAVGMAGMHLLALRNNQWSVSMWLIQTVLEAIGVIGLYFVLYRPVFDRVVTLHPALADIPVIGSTPEIIAVFSALALLAGDGSKLVRLWRYSSDSSPTTTRSTS
jgi:hypothetical protein